MESAGDMPECAGRPEGVANRIDPESCADAREGIGKALTGERMSLLAVIWSLSLFTFVALTLVVLDAIR